MRLATDHCAKLMNKINRNEMASINNATTDAPCTSYKSSFDIIINGAISETSGTLPAIKMTEPYSPSDRANPIPAPPINAGNTAGIMTFRNVVNLDAPKI